MTDSPIETARAFVDAVAWGEHRAVWDLLSTQGRDHVFGVAIGRGMDEEMVAGLRSGTAPPTDEGRFLVDLVNGLRKDLGGVDLIDIELEDGPVTTEGDQGTASPRDDGAGVVTVVQPVADGLAAYGAKGLPLAVLDLEQEAGSWRVGRVVPFHRR